MLLDREPVGQSFHLAEILRLGGFILRLAGLVVDRAGDEAEQDQRRANAE